jgi:dUTP pyrophosphatase
MLKLKIKMDRKQLENYIEQLKEYEVMLSGDEVDNNFIDSLNGLIKKISDDVSDAQKQPSLPKNNDLIIKVKKLHPNAVIPSYSKFGDAGMDLTITSQISNTTFDVSYGFGIAMEIPNGYVGLVFPRSSVRNQDLLLTNCVGVIDSGYRDTIKVLLKNIGDDPSKITAGDRIAQLVIQKVELVGFKYIWNDSTRGTGGFGSTGT